MAKPKAAFYWAASCGGCEISLLAIHEKIVEVASAVDIVFWPVAIDVKYKDVEAMEDKSIDLCMFNGAIRTGENEHLAKLLRRKSKIMVAHGSCAHTGGIPGLANFTTKEEIFNRAYHDNPSIDNPDGIVPQERTEVPEGELFLPKFFNTVKTLAQTVEVDYFMPGCPPVPEQTLNVFTAILEGKLPPAGTVIGKDEKTVCDQCKHEPQQKNIKEIKRPHELIIDPDKCLLEQGVICMGPATMAGCGAQCTSADMPCRGCYGPPLGVSDQGAKMCSALASIIDSNDEEEIAKIIDSVVDPAGTFYRFGLPYSTLRRTRT
ncbi:MAG TPA: oxidoreductase [Acidobacteriota bacterium]|nr:oxidoreductase [Acidobacteriota bacterium]